MFPDAKMDSPELIHRREQEAKYEAFKKRHSIYTHYNEDCEMPWTALNVWKARRCMEGCCQWDAVEIIAEYGATLDDYGYITYGKTESECVKWLAFRWQLFDRDQIDWSVITK